MNAEIRRYRYDRQTAVTITGFLLVMDVLAYLSGQVVDFYCWWLFLLTAASVCWWFYCWVQQIRYSKRQERIFIMGK